MAQYTSPPTGSHAPPRGPVTGGEPYCGNCGYVLTGLIESPRCPECGKPLVDVLMRSPAEMPRGRRFTSRATIFGWPVVHVALGPWPENGELKGKARGLIAIGDSAYGGIALGGFAVGGVALGGASIGVCALGGGAVGALTAMGGGAIGGFAVGGGAAGGIASGGGALGVVAQGGGAIGWYARGGGVTARYGIDPRRSDPEAVALFDALSPVLGSGAGTPSILPWAFGGAATGLLALVVLALAIWAVRRTERGDRGYA
jgi:hypothetical protein